MKRRSLKEDAERMEMLVRRKMHSRVWFPVRTEGWSWAMNIWSCWLPFCWSVLIINNNNSHYKIYTSSFPHKLRWERKEIRGLTLVHQIVKHRQLKIVESMRYALSRLWAPQTDISARTVFWHESKTKSIEYMVQTQRQRLERTDESE